MNEITTAHSSTPLDRIGYGSCGSVWSDSSRHPDIDQCTTPSIVLKRADGLPDRSIENEAEVHKHILSKASNASFNIPNHIAFLQQTAPTWSTILPRLPADARPCQALISERILPVPRATRRFLVERFWNGPTNMIDDIVNDKRNEHCLIRPYLGRRRAATNGSSPPRRNSVTPISLRNYPLYIDQIEALGLPAHDYASAMADGLAFLLWVAEVDACDVEFVLARPRPGGDDASNTFKSGPLGELALWILDFDCCRKLPLTQEGLTIAAGRFWRNDPFYPNPDVRCEADAALWDVFKHRFLKTSAEILAGRDQITRTLPGKLIARIVETVGVYSKEGPSTVLG
ncbi:zinc finger protein-domain-containing protein [Podospora conica]|nr:zinc finger protein-domain-containing protein [Schizothecium conicum]